MDICIKKCNDGYEFIGAVVTFNVRWADGSSVGFAEVGRLAEAARFIVRVGTIRYILLLRVILRVDSCARFLCVFICAMKLMQ